MQHVLNMYSLVAKMSGYKQPYVKYSDKVEAFFSKEESTKIASVMGEYVETGVLKTSHELYILAKEASKEVSKILRDPPVYLPYCRDPDVDKIKTTLKEFQAFCRLIEREHIKFCVDYVATLGGHDGTL
ncbi:hypothetical protein [Pasteurella phage vB_PmuP_PS07]|nr:hypothetical protein [Pasteurella phage vB_PmuP_PS07]UIS74023.1 hypothetical protein [Pasteurella phage vB_PmuP_PS30]